MLTAIVAYVAIKWDNGFVLLPWIVSMPFDAILLIRVFGKCIP
jgi:hypothetical protein